MHIDVNTVHVDNYRGRSVAAIRISLGRSSLARRMIRRLPHAVTLDQHAGLVTLLQSGMTPGTRLEAFYDVFQVSKFDRFLYFLVDPMVDEIEAIWCSVRNFE